MVAIHDTVLKPWTTFCPGCNQEFQLIWPNHVFQVRLEAKLQMTCPECGKEFEEKAARLHSCGLPLRCKSAHVTLVEM